ncbi:MAG: S26 family signal peptidase [Clostridia bacterium]|nr:S26 family signal peptidase [Clostridia bacterium]
MSEKGRKITNVVVNVVVVVILVFVAFITLNIILSRDKGYTPLFGSTYVAVQSDSMNGDKPAGVAENKPSGFKKGDLIKVKLLSDDQKGNLEVGDVITFYQTINGQRELNTHRIVDILGDRFETQGDNRTMSMSGEYVLFRDVIGQYNGSKIAGFGNVIDFFHSSTGFFVCVVLPCFLIVAYFAVNLILTVKKSKAEEKAVEQVDEKEKMRQELLQELVAQGKISAADVEPSEESAEPLEETEQPVSGAAEEQSEPSEEKPEE